MYKLLWLKCGTTIIHCALGIYVVFIWIGSSSELLNTLYYFGQQKYLQDLKVKTRNKNLWFYSFWLSSSKNLPILCRAILISSFKCSHVHKLRRLCTNNTKIAYDRIAQAIRVFCSVNTVHFSACYLRFHEPLYYTYIASKSQWNAV